MKWSLLLVLVLTGCIESPAQPVVRPTPIADLRPWVPPGPGGYACPQITEIMTVMSRDSITFLIRLKTPIAAAHGSTWFGQIVLGIADGFPEEIYVRGRETVGGRVPIRNSLGGGSFEIVGYGREWTVDANTVGFAVPLVVIGRSLNDEAQVLVQSNAPDQCGDLSYVYTEVGAPRWQRVRRTHS